jgi:hypothetical protein
MSRWTRIYNMWDCRIHGGRHSWMLMKHQRGASILINGRVVRVQQNFADFLRTSHPTSKKWLWIDAICINQSDSAERSQQIFLMLEIYSQAPGVLVWLGPESFRSDFAMVFVVPAEASKRLLSALEDDEWSELLHAVIRLFERTWWSPMWSQNRSQLPFLFWQTLKKVCESTPILVLAVVVRRKVQLREKCELTSTFVLA